MADCRFLILYVSLIETLEVLSCIMTISPMLKVSSGVGCLNLDLFLNDDLDAFLRCSPCSWITCLLSIAIGALDRVPLLNRISIGVILL